MRRQTRTFKQVHPGLLVSWVGRTPNSFKFAPDEKCTERSRLGIATMDESAAVSTSSPSPLASDALFAQVYGRLKAMAGRRLAQGRRDTLDTTALVHDLYLRMGAGNALEFAHPHQFFTYAARAMRHLLADRARDRLRQRAGGEWLPTTLTAGDQRLIIASAEQALALNDALQRLEQADARAARVVELTCFAGLSHDQAAETLGLSRSSIARDWRFARAFLKSELD